VGVGLGAGAGAATTGAGAGAGAGAGSAACVNLSGIERSNPNPPNDFVPAVVVAVLP